MIHKYVVDPRVAGQPFDFDRLVSGLGIRNGRLLSDDLPADWFEQAIAAVKALPSENDRAWATHFLQQLRTDGSKFCSTGVRGASSVSWIDSASASAEQFRAVGVISSSEISTLAPKNFAVVAQLLAGSHPLWEAPTTKTFEASISCTLEVVLPLTSLAGKTLVMDPYLGRDHGSHTLKMAAALIAALPRGYEVEFHSQFEFGSRFVTPSAALPAWESAMRTWLAPAAARSGAKVSVIRWKRRAGGNKLHARWVINKRGGISLDQGLLVKSGQTNVASILDLEWAREEYKRFKTRTKDALRQHDFELIDELEV